MRGRFRRVIFITACGAAVLALLYVTLTMLEPLSGDLQARLLTVAVLGIGGAIVAGLLVSSLLAAPVEQRISAILEVARRYAVGDLRRPPPDYGDDELGDVARAMDAAVQSLGGRVDELARDRTRMVAILASMVEGVLVVDEHGRLQHVNDAARRMLRLDHDAINRSYVEAIRHPGIAEQISHVLTGGRSEGLELSVARESNRTLIARVAPVIAAGRGAVLVLHDITDLRRADQIRRDFVANVSHELRTPLTAIKGYTEALLDEEEDDEESRRRFLEIIHRHSARMERLVADLLRLARMDAGQETMELTRCDVAALVRSLVSDFAVAASRKRQTVSVDVKPEACSLVVDPAKLHDILRNLIENAINYTPDGGQVTISADVHGGKHRLTVADTGPGIPPQDLERIFERFYRVDKSRTQGGTGLGLAIVKNLVSVLGGNIRVVNRSTGGAMFTVTLPLRDQG
jgi:signal transduction histidine kinase